LQPEISEYLHPHALPTIIARPFLRGCEETEKALRDNFASKDFMFQTSTPFI
jgi:hypothetical protein